MPMMWRASRASLGRLRARLVRRFGSGRLGDLLLLEIRELHDGFSFGLQARLARKNVHVGLGAIETHLRDLEARGLVETRVYWRITAAGYRAAAELVRRLVDRNPLSRRSTQGSPDGSRAGEEHRETKVLQRSPRSEATDDEAE